MADRYLLESGSPDGYLLEDGSGVLLLEAGTVEWSVSDQNAGVTLSNANLTATITSVFASVRANAGGTGKFYFEVSADAIGSAFNIGVSSASTSFADWVGDLSSDAASMKNDSSLFYSSGNPASGVSYTTADIIGIAVDQPNKLVWFAKNNTWLSGTDPAAGTGGKSVSAASGPLYPTFQGNFSTETATGKFTAASQTYAAPTGFTALDAVSGNNISGSSALTFAPSATLLGQGAVSASSTLAFAPSATLLGAGAVSGSSALAFSPSGTVNGLIVGTSTLLLSPSATLLGAGAISGTSTVVFAPSATLLGAGAVSGSSTLTFAPSSTLLGKGAVVGSSTIVFTPSATLFVANGISGTSSLTFGCSGTLSGAGVLLGSSALTFATVATLVGTGQLQGASGLSLAGSSSLFGRGQIAGATSFSLTVAGQLVFGLSGQVKVHILDEEQAKPIKVWNGVAWVTKPLKYWTGTAWRATSY